MKQRELEGTGDISFIPMKSNVLLDLTSICYEMKNYEKSIEFGLEL